MVANQGPNITGVSWSLGSLSLILVAIRLHTRVLVTRRHGWDDFFIAFSLATALVCSSLAQVAVSFGLGKHIDDITDPSDQINALKYTTIAPNFSVVSTTTGKISVVIFLLRLMGQSANIWQRWFLYVLTVVSIAWNIVAIIVIIGFCRPAEKIWKPDTEGSCFSLNVQLVGSTSQAAFNAFADLALALFPVIIFHKLQLPLVKKIGIITILGAGILAAAATLVKCVLLKGVTEHGDLTWTWAPIATWYTVEMYVIIICATIPVLPQCYNVLIHKTYSRSYYTYNNTTDPRSRTAKTISSRGRRQTQIRLNRMPDASLFETVAEEHDRENDPESARYGSQESILDRDQTHIRKTTEVTVIEEATKGEDDDPKYFPRKDPFRGSLPGPGPVV
ncbi:hypothetical protein BDW62DRAFT_205105 [Aspergillus aurantiobrunneus]